MNLEKLNHWLRLAANLGVMIGIILLAVELSQNRDMIRAQTRNELSQNLVELFLSDSSDANTAELMRRGYAGEELTDAERFMFSRRMSAWFRYWENMHYQYRIGLYDEIEFSKQREAIRNGLSRQPGRVEYWCGSRSIYSPEFAAEIDGLLTTHKCEPPQRGS